MTLYLLREGAYEEEREVALLSGPAGADVAALAQAFAVRYDHGERRVQARCVHLTGLPPGAPRPCVHEQERAAIRAWRAQQGWPENDAAEAFVIWLCSEQGFARLEYQDVTLDRLHFEPEGLGGPSAHVRVTYDPTYNGPGGADYERLGQGTLRTAYMPAALLRSGGGVPLEQQVRAWLRSALQLSEGNLVAVDVEALYDAEGRPLEGGGG